MTNKILAIITARGGSKGVPRKNINQLAGKPLIVHTIERALAVKPELLCVLVSTDDEEIAEISRKAGAYVPFLRPNEFATDEAASFDVVKHAVEYYEGKHDSLIDWSLILQPTTPLRTTHDISTAIQLTVRRETDTIVSVYDAEDTHPGKMKKLDKDGLLIPFISDAPWLSRRQDYTPKAYCTNGAIYMTRRDVLFEKSTLIGERVVPYVMPAARSIDIDTQLDFDIADILMTRQLQENKI